MIVLSRSSRFLLLYTEGDNKLKSRFMKEHSLAGRPTWALLKHRHEDLIRPSDALDDTGNMTHYGNTHERSDLVYN